MDCHSVLRQIKKVVMQLLCSLRYVIIAWLSYLFFATLHHQTHAMFAWMLGLKSSPYSTYGHALTWQNALYLSDAHSGVDYTTLLNDGYLKEVAVIGFTGPFFSDFFLLIISTMLLHFHRFKSQFTRWFVFCLFTWSLTQSLCLFFVRIFSQLDDLGLFVKHLDVSIWWLATPGFYILLPLYHQYFSRYIPEMHYKESIQQAIFCLAICVQISMLVSCLDARFNQVTHTIAIVGLLVLPFLFRAYFPRAAS